MSERRPMTDIERDIAERCMDGDRAGLRKAVEALSNIDIALCTAAGSHGQCGSVMHHLEAGAHPTPRIISAAINNGHVEALREMLGYVSLDAEYRGYAEPAVRNVLGETWGTDALEVLLDAGLPPSKGLARAAQAGHNSDALMLLRAHGLTEEELIQGVCAT